jgi:hypothetical protein
MYICISLSLSTIYKYITQDWHNVFILFVSYELRRSILQLQIYRCPLSNYKWFDRKIHHVRIRVIHALKVGYCNIYIGQQIHNTRLTQRFYSICIIRTKKIYFAITNIYIEYIFWMFDRKIHHVRIRVIHALKVGYCNIYIGHLTSCKISIYFMNIYFHEN